MGNIDVKRAPDSMLSVDGLKNKYGNVEHDLLHRKHWRDAVQTQETLLGYWEWVHQKTRT